MNVSVLIVEDELIISEKIRMYIEALGYEVCGQAIDYTEAIQMLEKHRPDFALLDITIGGYKSGIDLAKTIRRKFHIPFIFLSSHSDKETVQLAKEAQPYGYILKPFEKADLYTAIEVAMHNFSKEENENGADNAPEPAIITDSIFIKDNDIYLKIQLEDLRYIKVDNVYLELHLSNTMHLVRGALKNFLDKLPGNNFFPVHRSYAVNLKHISAIKATEVMVGDAAIPLGRTHREALLQKLHV